MKIRIEQEHSLLPFRCDIDALAGLLDDLQQLKFGHEKPVIHIVIYQGDAEIEFSDLDELRLYEAQDGEVVRFSFKISDGEDPSQHMCVVNSRYGSVAATRAVAANQAWCFGAIAIVTAFARRHRRWYWPLQTWAMRLFMLTFIAVCSTLTSLRILAQKSTLFSVAIVIFLVLCVSLLMAKYRVFPPATLVLHTRDKWVHRHLAEITTIAALLTAIATVCIAWSK